MMIYILKTTACLAIFLVFYKVFLEQENMHTFKRVYLLTSLILAFVIPTLLFTEYVYIEPQPTETTRISNYALKEFHATPEVVETNELPILLWSIYAFGVIIFGFKFCQNLFRIGYRIRTNPKIKENFITNVLLNEKLIPHTFFNFIFLNKQKFEAQEIPDEVLLHERTHAVEKHSLDVLFIELLQVILWFNPLVYLFKQAIKLNHEFLADQAVMQKGVEISNYQKILLAFSSNVPETQLANAINYSSIKKRFTVMKTQTSKKAIWLRSLLVLPLFALVLYGFSETEILEVQKPNANESIIQNIQKELESIDANEIEYDLIDQQKSDSIRYKYLTKPNVPTAQDIAKWKNASEYALWINGKHVNNKELENYKVSEFVHYSSSFVYDNARSERFPQLYQVHIYTKSEFEKDFTRDDTAINILTFNSENSLLIQNKFIKISELKDYLSDLNTTLSKEEHHKMVRANIYANSKTPKKVIEEIQAILKDYGCATIDIIGIESKQDGASKTQLSEYNILAEKYNSQPINKRIIKKVELEKLESIYKVMTSEQKQNAQPFPECPPPPAIDIIYTYERLLKRVKTNPVNREANLIYINKLYNEMSESQKNKVEDPKLVNQMIQQEKASREQVSEYNTLAKKYNTMNLNNMRIKKSEIDRMEYIFSIMTEKQKKSAQAFPELPPMPANAPKVMKGEVSNIPPPPASPISPLPQESASGFVTIRGEKYFYRTHNDKTDYYNKYGEEVDINGEVIVSIPPKVKKGEVSNIPPPPMPSTPKSPLDHIIEMAKKDATFYYEDREISSDKAIEIFKKNKNLNIDTRNSTSKKPIVRISKEPISIEN